MGFLKEVGAAIGVGNLDVTVECDEEIHPGDQVKGVATITGGAVPQIVQGLGLALAHRWEVLEEGGQQEEGEGAKVVHRRSMPVQIEVAPGSTHRVPFVLDIPLDVALPEPGDWHTVDVTADIPSAVDVAGSHRVSLWPSRPIADALRAIVSATGWTLEGYEPRKARTGFVRAVLAPGPAAAARFDRIYLELAPEEDTIRVHATLDLKERFWKELTGQDKHSSTFAASDVPTLVSRFQGLVDEYSTSP